MCMAEIEVECDDKFDILDGAVHAYVVTKGRERWRKAKDGTEVSISLLPASSIASEVSDNDAVNLIFVLGEEEADLELKKGFDSATGLQLAATYVGVTSAAEFASTVQECLKSMADGDLVKLSREKDATTASGSMALEIYLRKLEPAHWDLSGAARIAFAGRKRLLGNRHLQVGQAKMALSRYRDALSLVEFDDHFEDDDGNENSDADPSSDVDTKAGIPEDSERTFLGCSWVPSVARLEDVHAERERCLANLAAVSLQLSEFDVALKYCKRALSLNKSNAKLWFRKGRAEMSLGCITDAVTSFSEAMRLAPKDSEIAKALREARAAQVSERNAKRDSERNFLQASSDRNASDSKTSCSLATALWDGAAEQDRVAKKTAKASLTEEELAAELEYNKRQLLYHQGKQLHQKEAEID